MPDFVVNNTCPRCKRSYSVELRRMRTNLCSPCPTCGFLNRVSENQAIAAQRLLERLEMEAREPKVA